MVQFKVENLVKKINSVKQVITKKLKNNSIIKMESKLSSLFSTKIKIESNNNKKGKIEIYFESLDDLNRIIELIE